MGRRGGACTLYAIEKTKYDDFAKTYTPKEGSGSDPKLASFSATATKCAGAPSPLFVVAKTDARNAILEDLDVKALDASKCTIATRSVPDPANPTDSNGNPTNPNASSAAASDDGGCNVGGSAKGAAPWLVALAIPFFLLGRRRRNDKKA